MLHLAEIFSQILMTFSTRSDIGLITPPNPADVKKRFVLLLAASIFLAVSSCNKNIAPNAPPDPGGPDTTLAGYEPVTIALPGGSSASLQGASLWSATSSQPVSATGQSQALVATGFCSPAYLFDRDNNLLFPNLVFVHPRRMVQNGPSNSAYPFACAKGSTAIAVLSQKDLRQKMF